MGVQLNDPAVTQDLIDNYLTAAERAELYELLALIDRAKLFIPNPGPQYLASISEADIIGYGGAAGGGKSYLGAGLTTSHKRSAITRPQKNQTKKFVQELTKMLGSREGYSSQSSSFTFTDPQGAEHYVEFFGLDNPGDEEKQQGNDFGYKLYDEVTQMREADVRYTLTWNRTDDPDERVRALLTFNPPTTPEGRWVIKFFAPWLQKGHPNPAKDGELRWFTTIGDDQDFEVAGPQPFIVKRLDDGRLLPWYSFNAKEHKPEEIIRPKSRTFFHAKVTDNPYYVKTGYMTQLQMLPEPLRSQMLSGDFTAGMEDDAHQVIPSSWIDAANERWRLRQADMRATGKGLLDALGVDAARGGNMGSTLGAIGNDELVISPRYGTFFDELKIFKGVSIDDGAKASALIISELKDNAPVQIDVVGIGTSPYDFLRSNNIHAVPLNGAAASVGTDASGLLRFANMRAEWVWRMREALDPRNPEPIALPPDDQMAADLASYRWTVTKQGILIQSKDIQIKLLGRSPDRGDAIIYANISTPKLIMQVTGYANLPAHVTGESYEQRRLRELE